MNTDDKKDDGRRQRTERLYWAGPCAVVLVEFLWMIFDPRTFAETWVRAVAVGLFVAVTLFSAWRYVVQPPSKPSE